MSPIPKIRWAILSGWKDSKFSIFSPTPMNFTGELVIDLIDKAAPPLLSPSIRVSIEPVIFTASLKLFAIFAASCPVRASATSKVSCGLKDFSISINSFIKSSSTTCLPAVSRITTSNKFF